MCVVAYARTADWHGFGAVVGLRLDAEEMRILERRVRRGGDAHARAPGAPSYGRRIGTWRARAGCCRLLRMSCGGMLRAVAGCCGLCACAGPAYVVVAHVQVWDGLGGRWD